MKNKFTLTITDIDGSRHFTLHQIVKKFLLYFILFVIVVIVVGAWLIKYLSNEVETLQDKKDILVRKEYELRKKSYQLQRQVQLKADEFDNLQNKLSSIEKLIGITPDENKDLITRIKKIKLSASEQKALFQLIPNGNVVKYKRVSSPYGWRNHPIKKKKEFHPGIDLKAPKNTPVKAAADGVVEFAAFHAHGFGKLVILDHSYGFETRYAHLNGFNVKDGDFVKKGQTIGYVGNTGLSTGDHLHYEVRFIGRLLDPTNFLKWNRKNYSNIFEKETHVQWQSLVKMIMRNSQRAKRQSSKQHQKQQS